MPRLPHSQRMLQPNKWMTQAQNTDSARTSLTLSSLSSSICPSIKYESCMNNGQRAEEHRNLISCLPKDLKSIPF